MVYDQGASDNHPNGGELGGSESGSAVGTLLRASRMRVGEELRDVASALRIRYPYLEAIEEGRYTDLPGSAYAVGFVRGYAEHLGLDSEEIVRRFKAETSEAVGATKLVFPSPVTETVMPGGAVIFIGIILASIAYGVWYVGTSEDNPIAAAIAPIPERLSEMLNSPADTSEEEAAAQEAPATSEPKAEVAVVEPEKEMSVSESAPSPEEATEQVAEQVAAVSAAPPAEEAAPAQQPQAEAKPTETQTETPTTDAVSETVASVETAITPAATEMQAAVDPVAPDTPSTVAEASSVEPVTPVVESIPPASTPETAAAPETVTPPVTVKPAGPKIEVRATAASWIQVRDNVAQSLIMTRLLRPGDTYTVPDRKGLILVTGNAGALDILVDGKSVPAIGGSGAVRRSVALDAEKLKAGVAVAN